MRWEELTSRAKTSPTAALGMLDIIYSRGGPDSEGWNHLSPVMIDALELVSAQTPSRESWEFLFALNAKVDWTNAPGRLAGTLEERGSITRSQRTRGRVGIHRGHEHRCGRIRSTAEGTRRRNGGVVKLRCII